jgi:hypothetical protein
MDWFGFETFLTLSFVSCSPIVGQLSNEFKFPIAAVHHASEAYLVPALLKQAYGRLIITLRLRDIEFAAFVQIPFRPPTGCCIVRYKRKVGIHLYAS